MSNIISAKFDTVNIKEKWRIGIKILISAVVRAVYEISNTN